MEVYRKLSSDNINQQELSYCSKLVEIIGDNMVQKKLKQVCLKNMDGSLQVVSEKNPKDTEKLMKLKEQLQSTLNAVNEILEDSKND